jgi:hypothetical protein
MKTGSAGEELPIGGGQVQRMVVFQARDVRKYSEKMRAVLLM